MNAGSCAILLLALTSGIPGSAQGVVINELQCAGDGPDRVELLNTGSRPIDPNGLRFTLKDRTAVLEGALILRRGERCVVTFGSQTEAGLPHIGFGLPRSGGNLLMISADGSSILDLCSWPAMPADVSIGRQPDGGAGWSFFAQPSFGSGNSSGPSVQRIASTPHAERPAGSVAPGSLIPLSAEAGCTIRYTVDGSVPTWDNGFEYTAPIAVERNTIIKARTFKKDELPSPDLTGTYITSTQATPWVALNFPRSDGWDGAMTEATVELFGIDTAGVREVKVRESGSGSRSLPKRNLKIKVHRQGTLPWPEVGAGHEAMLRADATPHAFLHNRFMECIARQAGSHVDVQTSLPVDLYFNGSYHGLYRLMPPKDEDWLRAVHGHEAMDVLHGPSLRRIDGDREHVHAAYEALLTGAPVDTLETLIDVASLVDLACFDLWTGRADHDLNVRCWRPKLPGGKWRWILYDMDLWAPSDDNSLARMCGEAVPVAPYLPQLLYAPTLRDRLLARMSAMLATVLEPAHARTLVDSLYQAHEDALIRDHARWKDEMEIPTPQETRDALRAFTDQRNTRVLEQLSERTGLGLRTLSIATSPENGGSVQIEGLPLPELPMKFTAFDGVPMHLQAIPAEGYEFVEWKQMEGDDTITVDPRKSHKLTAVFRHIGTVPGTVSGSSHHRLQQPDEERLAIRVPQARIGSTLGVRHHAENVAAFVAHPGDVLHAAVRVRIGRDVAHRIAIAEKHLLFSVQFLQRIRARVVAALTMSDRNAHSIALQRAGDGAILRLRLDEDIPANELLAAVVEQGTGQQACLAQHLETVAHTEDQASYFGMRGHFLHDG